MKLRSRAHALIRRACGADTELPADTDRQYRQCRHVANGKERNHNEPATGAEHRDRDL